MDVKYVFFLSQMDKNQLTDESLIPQGSAIMRCWNLIQHRPEWESPIVQNKRKENISAY